MRAVPSLGRIVWTDYWAFLSLLGFLVGWGIYLAIVFLGVMPTAQGPDPLMGEGGAPFFFWFAVGATVIGVPGLIWRTSMIRGLFENGVQIEGVITGVLFFRDRGRAEFTYTYEGQQYQGGNPLHKTERAKALWEGQPVALVIDPQRPQRAFIQHLFVDQP